jgi:hypothetical protein
MSAMTHFVYGARAVAEYKRVYLKKFLDWVDDEIYAYNNKQ